jgi:hypothetical protein
MKTTRWLSLVLLPTLACGGSSSSGGTAGTTGSAAVGDASAGEGGRDGSGAPPGAPKALTLLASQARISPDACGATPAVLADVAAGTHTVALTASTLSKGFVLDTPAKNDYVLVKLPLPPGDADAAHRYFMLNGVGTSRGFTLPAAGSIALYFVDSDNANNSGTGTVTLDGSMTATVDAVANVLRWDTGCHSDGAELDVTDRAHHVTLTASSLSTGSGSKDDYVLVRLPREIPVAQDGFVVLNGVGDGVDFTPFRVWTIHAWFLADVGATGEATLTVSDL